MGGFFTNSFLSTHSNGQQKVLKSPVPLGPPLPTSYEGISHTRLCDFCLLTDGFYMYYAAMKVITEMRVLSISGCMDNESVIYLEGV